MSSTRRPRPSRKDKGVARFARLCGTRAPVLTVLQNPISWTQGGMSSGWELVSFSAAETSVNAKPQTKWVSSENRLLGCLINPVHATDRNVTHYRVYRLLSGRSQFNSTVLWWIIYVHLNLSLVSGYLMFTSTCFLPAFCKSLAVEVFLAGFSFLREVHAAPRAVCIVKRMTFLNLPRQMVITSVEVRSTWKRRTLPSSRRWQSPGTMP